MDIKNIRESVKSTQLLNRLIGALDGKSAGAAKRVLNAVLPQVIPFNRPLGLKIIELSTTRSEVEIPFKRANKNHLGGMHACAMATVGEYTAGLLILRRADISKQRLVLKTLKVDYLKQGRAPALALCEWPEGAPQSIEVMRHMDEAIELKMLTVLRAKDGLELAHIHTHWQVKPWSQVRS